MVLIVPARYTQLVDRSARTPVFWTRADDGAWSETKSQWVTVTGDGSFATSVLELSQHPEWRGTITRLRFDPVLTGSGGVVSLDFLEARRRR